MNNTYCTAIKKVLFSRGAKDVVVSVSDDSYRMNANGEKVEKPDASDAKAYKMWLRLPKNPANKSIEHRKLLVTTVDFEDNTRVTVMSSDSEPIYNAEGVVLESAKISGIAMAIAKRLLGTYEVVEKDGKLVKTNTITGNGFNRRINKILKMSYDVQEDGAKNAALKKQKKEANVQKQIDEHRAAVERKRNHPSQYALLKSIADKLCS